MSPGGPCPGPRKVPLPGQLRQVWWHQAGGALGLESGPSSRLRLPLGPPHGSTVGTRKEGRPHHPAAVYSWISNFISSDFDLVNPVYSDFCEYNVSRNYIYPKVSCTHTHTHTLSQNTEYDASDTLCSTSWFKITGHDTKLSSGPSGLSPPHLENMAHDWETRLAWVSKTAPGKSAHTGGAGRGLLGAASASPRQVGGPCGCRYLPDAPQTQPGPNDLIL